MMFLNQSEVRQLQSFADTYQHTSNSYKKAVIELKVSHWLNDIRADVGTILYVQSLIKGGIQ